MNKPDGIYRVLQQHLNQQAVGFPATRSGADIRLLQRLFTPEEAQVALLLSYRPAPLDQIADHAAPGLSPQQTAQLLDRMLTKGAVGWKEKNGSSHWFLLPLVVGMYEGQDGAPTPEFLDAVGAYMQTMAFGKSFLTVKPAQMRTIPIGKSIPVEHHIATYDQLRALVQDARGPFVVIPCICRAAKALQNKPCAQTSRRETCLGFDDVAAMILRRQHGRQITRDEVLAILQQNEEDGLVLQPANARQPGFVCSCCGCCCGMLGFQKWLPHPVDFWASNFQAEIATAVCAGCGKCVVRCQVRAVALTGPDHTAQLNLGRCIGCGLCVPTCATGALRLRKKAPETVPPQDGEQLYDEIMANKQGAWERWRMLMKVALQLRL